MKWEGQVCGDCVFCVTEHERPTEGITKSRTECRARPPQVVAWIDAEGKRTGSVEFPVVWADDPACGLFEGREVAE